MPVLVKVGVGGVRQGVGKRDQCVTSSAAPNAPFVCWNRSADLHLSPRKMGSHAPPQTAAVHTFSHISTLQDVAGLVPGAYQGRGKGNAFLNDLTDADVLLHVVDVSGSTDREGQLLQEGEGGDPLDDVG